jgi:hypothetical protein
VILYEKVLRSNSLVEGKGRLLNWVVERREKGVSVSHWGIVLDCERDEGIKWCGLKTVHAIIATKDTLLVHILTH